MPTGIGSNNSTVVTADFTGTGTLDFLLCPTSKDKFYFFDDIVSGGTQYGELVNTGSYREIFPVTWLTYNDKVLSGQGMLLARDNGVNKYKFDVYASVAYTPVLYQYTKYWDNPITLPGYHSTCDGFYYPGPVQDVEFISGDFNGDGLTDIIAVSKNIDYPISDYIGAWLECVKNYAQSGSAAYFVNMDRRKTSGYVANLGAIVDFSGGSEKLYTADFDGDGKTDFMVVKSGSMYVYSLNDAGTGLILKWTTTDSRIQTNEVQLLGDYNGDGKMDIMFSTGYNSLFTTFMSTGKGFVKREQNQPFSRVQDTWNGSTGTMKQHMLIPNDVNGDGKTDIIYARTTTYNSTPSGNIYTVVHHNTGMSSTSAPLFAVSASTTVYTHIKHNPIPLFLNPDRQNPDLEFGFVSDNTISLFRSHKDMQKQALLETVQHDGLEHTVTYGRLMSGANGWEMPLYGSSLEQTYPYVNIEYAPSMRVVDRLTKRVSPSGYGFAQRTFSYKNAVSNADGLGFVGFGELIRSNWHRTAADTNRTFTIAIQDPELRGANLRTFTSKSFYINPTILNTPLTDPPPIGGVPDGATLSSYISRQDVLYHTDTLANRTFVNVPIVTSAKDLLSGTYRNSRMQYDSYYNTTYVKEDINNEASQRSGMSYANSTGTPYYIGRLLAKRDTSEHSSDIYTTEEQYAYTGYLPTEIKRKGHDTDFVIDSLTYDTYGNVTQRKTTVPGGAQRTETMQYDFSGRFMTKYTDPDGGWINYFYNGDGTLYQEYDYLGSYFVYLYDYWQRVEMIWDDSRFTYKYIYYTRSGSDTHIEEVSTTGTWGLSIYNAMGQKVEKWANTVTGTVIGKATKYDPYGRVYSESRPSSPGIYSQWNTINYDKYGRVLQETSYTGKTYTYNYSGLTTTINDAAKSTVSTRDALGNTLSVQDPGGTVYYSYYANGNLKETDYGGSVQTIEQDGWGQKTKLIDPSAGVYAYSYDGWGQVTQETTPKGQTTYVYDAAGKLTSRSITGDNTDMQQSYTYAPSTKLLVGSTLVNADGNNTTYSYAYDYMSRLLNFVEDNVHARFEKQYSYLDWQLDSETTIAKEKTTNDQYSVTWKNHYENGQLEKVTLDGTEQVLWQIDALNANGLVTDFFIGTNLQTSFSYNSYGYPIQHTLTRTSPSATLMTLGTTFNAQRGFPTSRSNSVFSWSETFVHDNLDRLTGFNDNNGSHSQSYDARGRITSNTLQGTYSYTGNSYRQDELSLNTSADLYYQARTPQQISFNAFKKPVEIYEAGHDGMNFQYNGALQRAHSYYGSEDIDPLDRPYRRHYSEDGSAEITRDMLTGETSFVFYLGGDAYSASAIWKVVQDSSTSDAQLYYLHRDYLGSILMITDSIGTVAEQRQFDAWGNIVKLTDGSNNPLTKFAILDRGYTGHEHLFGVALINMNGRLYDARLRRFLSPDNFVQNPWGTQGFNRYGYAMNSPLMYVDPGGEFILGTVFGFVGGLVKTIFSGGLEFWNADKQYVGDAWGNFGRSVSNGFKIDVGLWKGDFWQVFSRFTWELPQTLVGYGTSSTVNGLQNVRSVSYYKGATAVETYSRDWGGVTLSNYIIGELGLQADPNNSLFQHEYGHYLQSRVSGLFYFPKYGIPSLFSKGGTAHHLHPSEQDANARAFRYFNENIDGYDGWVFIGKGRNPITGYDFTLGYNDPNNQLALQNARLKLSWYDYLMLPIWPLGGVVNTFILNSRY